MKRNAVGAIFVGVVPVELHLGGNYLRTVGDRSALAVIIAPNAIHPRCNIQGVVIVGIKSQLRDHTSKRANLTGVGKLICYVTVNYLAIG